MVGSGVGIQFSLISGKICRQFTGYFAERKHPVYHVFFSAFRAAGECVVYRNLIQVPLCFRYGTDDQCILLAAPHAPLGIMGQGGQRSGS